MLINNTVTNKWPLNENSQKSDFKLAFGTIKNDAVVNVTPWFLCRDFFNDFLIDHMAHEQGYDLHFHEIYSYNFKDSWKHDKDDLVLLINKLEYLDLDLFTKYLNDWEEKYDSKSTTKRVDDIIIIKFPRFWVNNHILFSIYTFFARYLINIVKGSYTFPLGRPLSLHYSDHEIFYHIGGDKPIYELYNFDKLINDLKNITEESKELMDTVYDILTDDWDEDYRSLEEHIMRNARYNVHNFGFINYLEKSYNEYNF